MHALSLTEATVIYAAHMSPARLAVIDSVDLARAIAVEWDTVCSLIEEALLIFARYAGRPLPFSRL